VPQNAGTYQFQTQDAPSNHKKSKKKSSKSSSEKSSSSRSAQQLADVAGVSTAFHQHGALPAGTTEEQHINAFGVGKAFCQACASAALGQMYYAAQGADGQGAGTWDGNSWPENPWEDSTGQSSGWQ
jgi:hypothetical protein